MKLSAAAEDVLTPKQLVSLTAQAPELHRGNMEAARQLGITVCSLKLRRTRARKILQSIGLDPQWKRK